MKISMIVAYGKNGEIGLDNKMLWYIPEDFKNFKKITLGHHILMGRKTHESIGKILPSRTNLVLTKSSIVKDGAVRVSSIPDAIKFADYRGDKELIIIGGASIYKEAFPKVQRMYLSRVDYSGPADAYINEIDFRKWKLIKEELNPEVQTENNKPNIPAWTFQIWDRK